MNRMNSHEGDELLPRLFLAQHLRSSLFILFILFILSGSLQWL